jgi:AbrB family looped-hinge helix DNA binding protein
MVAWLGLLLRSNSARLSFEMTTTVDNKGSVPLPAEVLRDSGVHPGDQLDISAEDGDIILRKIAHVASESLLDILRGLKGLPISERTRSPVREVQL